jgi:hypothetical protein
MTDSMRQVKKDGGMSNCNRVQAGLPAILLPFSLRFFVLT